MEEGARGVFPAYKIYINAKAITSRMALSTIATEISADRIIIITERPIFPKTRVTITFELQQEVQLQGNVAWVLDTQTEDGEHFYLTGIDTDVILHPNIKAVGLAEKSRLLQDVLFEVMVRSQN